MTHPRFIFGIMQCVLALLLLVGGPNQAHPSSGATLLRPADGAGPVLADAHPHKGALKREAEQNLTAKRGHWPGPKGVVPARPEKGAEPTGFVEAAFCIPPAPDGRRRRICASPPTGPPST